MNSVSKFDRFLLYAVSVVVLALAGVQVSGMVFKPKTAYVDIGRMLEEYKFKKSLEDVSASGLTQIKAVIDSFEMVRRMGAGTPQLDTQLTAAKYAFQDYYARSGQEISKKIWERLNPLMEQYGKEKGFKLLIGATGNGALLYGDKSCDVTDDVVRYINTRFEKGS